jgi:hypothetical protein
MADFNFVTTRMFVSPDDLLLVDCPVTKVTNTLAAANTWYDLVLSGTSGSWPIGAEDGAPSVNYTVAHDTKNKITCSFVQRSKMRLTIVGRIISATASTDEIDLAAYDDAIGNDPDDSGALIFNLRMDNVSHTAEKTFFIDQVVDLGAAAQIVLAIRDVSSIRAPLVAIDYLMLRRP